MINDAKPPWYASRTYSAAPLVRMAVACGDTRLTNPGPGATPGPGYILGEPMPPSPEELEAWGYTPKSHSLRIGPITWTIKADGVTCAKVYEIVGTATHKNHPITNIILFAVSEDYRDSVRLLPDNTPLIDAAKPVLFPLNGDLTIRIIGCAQEAA